MVADVNGDGTFTRGPATCLTATPDKIAMGDFNNDGVLDFAATNFRTNVDAPRLEEEGLYSMSSRQYDRHSVPSLIFGPPGASGG